MEQRTTDSADWQPWFEVAIRLDVSFAEFYAAVTHLGIPGRLHCGRREWSRADRQRLADHFAGRTGRKGA